MQQFLRDEGPTDKTDGPAGRLRLHGWKAISNYLGKDRRTAERWAVGRKMPVHRVPNTRGRGSVFAWSDELDNWLIEKPLEEEPVKESTAVTASRPKVSLGARERGLLLVIGGLLLVLFISLNWTGQRGAASMTSDPLETLPNEVNELYLNATYLWEKRTPQTLRQAEAMLARVVYLVPSFADAQADLSMVYNLMVEYQVLPADEGYTLSEAAAEKALAIDPNSARALMVLGDSRIFWHLDYAAGRAFLERAVLEDPTDETARQWYASALMATGRFREAGVEIDKARRLAPTSRSIQVSAAMIDIGNREFERAREKLMQLIENEPGYRSPYRFLSFVELAAGNWTAYLDALETRFTLTEDIAGLAAVTAGQSALARGEINAIPAAMLLAARAGAETVEPYFLAHVLALNGLWPEAADQLGKTPTRHAFYFTIDPAFATARAEPEFLDKIAVLGLPLVP